jgi:hypothetical protein
VTLPPIDDSDLQLSVGEYKRLIAPNPISKYLYIYKHFLVLCDWGDRTWVVKRYPTPQEKIQRLAEKLRRRVAACR